MHYNNKRERELAGLSDRNKQRYDKNHGFEHINRLEVSKARKLIQGTETEYLLGMRSDEYLNKIQQSQGFNDFLARMFMLNYNDLESFVLQDDINEYVVAELRFRDCYSTMSEWKYNSIKGFYNAELKTFDLRLFQEYNNNYCFMLVNGTLFKLTINIKVNAKYFDTKKLILFNSIINHVFISASDSAFENNVIGGFLRTKDTNNFAYKVFCSSDIFVFNNIVIQYHGFMGEIGQITDNEDESLDEDLEKDALLIDNTPFCECKDCIIYDSNSINAKQYGVYKRFGNTLIKN